MALFRFTVPVTSSRLLPVPASCTPKPTGVVEPLGSVRLPRPAGSTTLPVMSRVPGTVLAMPAAPGWMAPELAVSGTVPVTVPAPSITRGCVPRARALFRASLLPPATSITVPLERL